MSAQFAMQTGLALPWLKADEQERRFRRLQLKLLATVLLLSLLIRWLPLPEIPPLFEPVAPQPIELRLQPKPVAVPPLSVKAEVAAPAAVAEAAPKPVPPKPLAREAPQPLRDSTPGSAPPGPSARDRANAAGISQLANDLASLRDSSAASKAITGRPEMTAPPNPDFTSDLNGGQDRGAGSERALITSRAGQGSGGINTAALSRGTGGGGLAGRGTTQVAGYGGGGTGTGPGIGNGRGGNGAGGGNGTGSGAGNGSGSGSGGSRSREEIEMVFDQNKGAIYALYSRALRSDPSLRGKMVLRLTITPDGVVTECSVVSSEIDAPEFQHQLVQRVLLFRFQARDVAPVTTTKPIDFFPG